MPNQTVIPVAYGAWGIGPPGSFTKNVCVGRSYRAARYLQLIPPNDYLALLPLRLPYCGLDYYLDYCPPGDPGHTVNVTLVEPSLRSVLNGHLTGASR